MLQQYTKMNVFGKPDEQHEARFKCCHGEKRCMLMNVFGKPDEQHKARFKCCHGEKRCRSINSFLADISREVAVDALCAIVHQIETENRQTHENQQVQPDREFNL